jgi:ParB-like chromosome segregation protein Spo0J
MKNFKFVETITLQIHPKADLMPRMTDAEFEDLKRDVGTFGIKVPLLVLEGTNQIIDGRHRYWAALEKSVIDIPVRYISNDAESLEMLIISIEAKRKHRSKSTYTTIVAGLFSAAKSVGKKKKKLGESK